MKIATITLYLYVVSHKFCEYGRTILGPLVLDSEELYKLATKN